jgi:methyl-accepting chemotaxis protein
MNMTALLSSFVVAVGLLGTVSPALSQQSPPRSAQTQQIEALVNKAAALVERKGKAAFAEFRKKDSEWWIGESYLFAYDLKLNVLLVAAFPQNEGKNQTGKTDSKGKRYHDEFVKAVQSKGAGWVNYMFPRPGQTEPSEKWSYVKAVNIDGTPGSIGSGFYPR